MTVYCFYYYSTDSESDNSLILPILTSKKSDNGETILFTLYACTSEKEFATQFRKTRNMDKFFEKRLDLTKEEYNRFYNDYSDRFLEDNVYLTVTKGEKHPVVILSTGVEHDTVVLDAQSLMYERLYDLDPWIYEFKSHHFVHKISKLLKRYFMFDEILEWANPYEEIPFNKFYIDEASVYVYLFKFTYK